MGVLSGLHNSKGELCMFTMGYIYIRVYMKGAFRGHTKADYAASA